MTFYDILFHSCDVHVVVSVFVIQSCDVIVITHMLVSKYLAAHVVKIFVHIHMILHPDCVLGLLLLSAWEIQSRHTLFYVWCVNSKNTVLHVVY